MTQQSPQGERLARYLAHAGIASRRHAEILIEAGRVRVNGQAVTEQGSRIDPEHDSITVDGKLVEFTGKLVYILLNKPAGYVSTANDPQKRPTVLDLLPPELRRLRVYPVGRLDIDTSGLLLLTNDGDFALHLTHPRYSMDKHYRALIKGCPPEKELNTLRRGVDIVEDKGGHHRTSPAQVNLYKRADGNCWLSLTIHEGHKRQVRRMLTAIGFPVLELKRVGIGSLELGDVAVGKWRYLTEAEVNELRNNQ